MEDAERARDYERFTEPPDTNRIAALLWLAQARRYRRRALGLSAGENREVMRQLEPAIAELEGAETDDREAARAIHQLKAMWFYAYEAVASSASSQEK